MKLELTEQMIQTIGLGLGELPFKQAAPVITELQKQITEQTNVPSPAEPATLEQLPDQPQ
jgi:hypothetical protein